MASDDFTLPSSGGRPVLLVATTGQTLVISTSLAGEPPFAHQWLRNGQAIAGAAGVGDSPLLQVTTPVPTATDDGVQSSVVVGIRSSEALRTAPVQIPALASIDRRVSPRADTEPVQLRTQ